MKIFKVQDIISYILIAWLLLIEVTIIPDLIKNIIPINSFYILYFLFAIFLSTHFQNYKNIQLYKFNLFYLFIILVSIFFLIELLDAFNLGFENSSRVFIYGIDIFIVVAIIVLNRNFLIKEKLLKSLISPYMHINIFIVMGGVLVFFLVQADLVNMQEWQFINQYMKKSDEGQFGLLYSMPYFLNIILSGAEGFEIFGIKIIRLSGLSIEPSVSSLFSTPFLFLIGFYFKKTSTKNFFYLITVLYLLFTASLTNIIAISIIFAFVILRNSGVILKVIPIVFVLFLLSLSFESDESSKGLFSRLNGESSRISQNIIVSEIVNADTFFGQGVLSESNIRQRGIINVVYFYTMYSIIIIFSLYSFFRYGGIERLLPLYLLMHSMKTQHHFWYFPFSLFFILVIVLFIQTNFNRQKNYKMVVQ